MNEEIGLPKATILNLIKDCLPNDCKISNETNDMILAMSCEFVNHLSSTSNDICLEGGKKTISQSHVAESMKNMKLQSYLAKILNVEDSKDIDTLTDKKRKEMLNSSLNVKRKKKKGLTPEEHAALLKKQQELFQSHNAATEQEPAQQTHETPTFNTVAMPSPQGEIYKPNQLKFYDGSITQILNDPQINQSMTLPQPTQGKVELTSTVGGSEPPPQPPATADTQTKDEEAKEVNPPASDTPDEGEKQGKELKKLVSMGDVSASPAVSNPILMKQFSLTDIQRQKSKVIEETEDFE